MSFPDASVTGHGAPLKGRRGPASPASRFLPLLAAQVAGSATGFLTVCSLLPDSFQVNRVWILLLAVLTLGCVATGWAWLREDPALRTDAFFLAGTGIALGTLAVSAWYALACYASVPVDIVSYSESSFVNDIIKWRAGIPIFTPGVDNNAYPYMPGTQLLTYWLAGLLGDPASIPLMRHVVLGYVVAAAFVAAYAADRLVLLGLDGPLARLRPMWWWIAACVAWLAASDPRFNMFVHSLHNDGLVLLVTVLTFAAAVTHLRRPSAATWVAMAVLPVAGYLVKQSLLIWAPLLAVLLLLSGRATFRQVVFLAAATAALTGAVTWYGYLRWGGDDFIFWVFQDLGVKEVAPARSLRNLLFAGGYLVALVMWIRVVLVRGTSRPMLALFLASVGLFLVEGYTSGIGFTPNHLGPGVLLASVWGVLALIAAWPWAPDEKVLVALGQRATLAVLPLFFLGGLGLFREPRNEVPPDLARYTAAIEAEFADLPADRVLLDMGSWPYLREGVVMKDRADPVAEHAGANQAYISHHLLAETLRRIRSRAYARILVRNIEGPATPYDFQFRGTGVRQAMLEEYRIVRRIPPVKGVTNWWPPYLLDEIAVLEPRPGPGAP